MKVDSYAISYGMRIVTIITSVAIMSLDGDTPADRAGIERSSATAQVEDMPDSGDTERQYELQTSILTSSYDINTHDRHRHSCA